MKKDIKELSADTIFDQKVKQKSTTGGYQLQGNVKQDFMISIFHTLFIHASKAKVYEAITTQEGLRQWWSKDCKAKPEVGCINEFIIDGLGHHQIKVIDLQEEQYVEWACVQSVEEWMDTHIIFDLQERENGTRLNFHHRGYASKDEFYECCNYHWARHLAFLKECCEVGDEKELMR